MMTKATSIIIIKKFYIFCILDKLAPKPHISGYLAKEQPKLNPKVGYALTKKAILRLKIAGSSLIAVLRANFSNTPTKVSCMVIVPSKSPKTTLEGFMIINKMEQE